MAAIPPRVSPARYRGFLTQAEKAHRALGCSGATRIDLIVSESGNEYVLEVNTLPGLTPTSLLPKSVHSLWSIQSTVSRHPRKAEIRRQPFGDGFPGVAIVVAAQHANPRTILPAAMVLHIEPPGRIWMAGNFVNALTEFRKGIGHEPGTDSRVGGLERFAAVFA